MRLSTRLSGRKILLGSLLLCFIAVGYVVSLITNTSPDTSEKLLEPSLYTRSDLWQTTEPKQTAMASAEKRSSDTSKTDRATPLTTVNKAAILQELTQIRVDELGNLKVDDQGLKSLYNTLGYGQPKLDARQIAQVQTIIRNNLPEPTAQQTAAVVGDFSRYLEAKAELDALYPENNTTSQLSIYLAELNTLREMIFGDERANQLFHEQRSNENYMLHNMELSQNPDFNQEQLAQQRTSLQDTYLNNSTPSTNWQSRVNALTTQVTAIEQSTLSDREKHEQVQDLINSQFTPEEREQLDSSITQL